MTIHPLFTVHMLRPFHAFSNVLDFIEAELSIKTFNTLSGVRTVFLTVPQIHILCTSAVKRYYAYVHVSPVSCALKFMEARKTCHRLVRTSIWSIPYSGELCDQNCVVKTSETLITWSAFCYTAGSDKSDAIQGVPDRLLKRTAVMFRVHSRQCWIAVDLLIFIVSNDCQFGGNCV